MEKLWRNSKTNGTDQEKTFRHGPQTGNVQAEFRYWSRSSCPRVSELFSVMNGTHASLSQYMTEVCDIRASSVNFEISKHGFQVIHHDLSTIQASVDYLSEPSLATHYWPSLAEVVKAQLGARIVTVFRSVVRNSFKDIFPVVHNDCSPTGARNLLRAVLPSFFHELSCATVVKPEDQEKFFNLRRDIIHAEDKAARETGCRGHSEWDGTRYEGPRWALLSVWRPLKMVTSDPIGVLDSTSMFQIPSTFHEKCQTFKSVCTTQHGHRGVSDFEGSAVVPSLPQARQHRWYWLHKQHPDEVLLIKLFDSEAWLEGSHTVPFCAHSAFSVPNDPNSTPRASIETRVFVIW